MPTEPVAPDKIELTEEERNVVSREYRRFDDNEVLLPRTMANNVACAILTAERNRVKGERCDRPRIVCLCGSTRFWREFQRSSLSETMAGRIVLSIGAASGTDDEHFGNLPREEYDRVKTMLDELHKRKIDLADEVLVLNVGGYIGSSTRSEIDYAIAHNKPVRYLEVQP